jgi:replication factor C small subunit
MLWTEKYRPAKLNQIIGQEHFILDAETWVESKIMPNVLFYGNSGTGKTAAGLALAKTLLGKYALDNFFEINASDDRRLETVRTHIKDIAQSGTIGDVDFRIILLDEMDGMTTDAQNALKRIMERYANNVRFIITCNDKSKIIFALQSRCANYHFKILSNEVMLDAIKNILKAEGLENIYDDKSLSPFIGSFHGDLRRAITELQAATSTGNPLKLQVQIGLKEYENIIDEIINKNTNAISLLHDLLYDGRSVKEICVGMHDIIIESKMDNNTKYKFLRVIGESEWRSTNLTPRVLVSWMIGQLI